jgi:probable rRNA maturation factor
MVLNRQKEVSIDLPATRNFVLRLRRTLRLGKRDFNVCFVQDHEITRLNSAYRGKARPTDVLSFPWYPGSKHNGRRVSKFEFRVSKDEFRGFLGDIVIAAPTARRNARAEGHSTAREIRWLILHGVLHLLGHDHETDHGEMTALELAMRERLGT